MRIHSKDEGLDRLIGGKRKNLRWETAEKEDEEEGKWCEILGGHGRQRERE